MYQGRPTSQIGSWGTKSTLPDNNLVKELFLQLSTKYISTKMLFHKRLFHKMLSTKCRKYTMGGNQGSLG